MSKSAEITNLLNRYQKGDQIAFEALTASVYSELHKIARAYMRQERSAHTLQPTALVGEAYLRLFQGKVVTWESRRHFYRVAAAVMRHVLVDHARKRGAKKRGEDLIQVSFDESLHGRETPDGQSDILALDRVLTQLAELDPLLAQLVELRYFGGLDLEQTASVLKCSVTTVKRHWTKARLWLQRELEK